MKSKKMPGGNFVGCAALILLWFLPVPVSASPLYSPRWGFRIDLPEGYEYTGGDGKDRFSFQTAEGACLDLMVYPAMAGANPVESLVKDVLNRLGNKGDISYFDYGHKNAALMELNFSIPGGGKAAPVNNTGWGLCVELAEHGRTGSRPMLLALAYGPAGKQGLQILHFSALDSIAPAEEDRRIPGPVTEFTYPRRERKKAELPGFTGGPPLEARIYTNDAEASQALTDREFAVLRLHTSTPAWKEAWIRFYRAIYRDSFDRLADAAFVLERRWNVPPPGSGTAGDALPEGPGRSADTIRAEENRALGEKALAWVQSFRYERDLLGSDFVNPISAALEGRGDCDSRAMVWAIILNHADIPAAIMVSREYSHAMGLADLAGTGARFEAEGTKWLVAETTAAVPLGLIAKENSEIESWLGVIFE